MHRLHLLFANALPAILDFGVGALLAVSVTHWLGGEMQVWTWLLGGVLALVPDFDVIPSVLRGQSTPFDHHQTLFHRPVITISFASVLCYLLLGSNWALIAVACVTWHFLHDTGWLKRNTGIAWLWPLSDKFLSWYGLYEIQAHVEHHVWLRRYWTQPTLVSVVEITVGLGALSLALYEQQLGWPWLLLFPLTGLSLTVYVWMVKHSARW